jgi:maleate isomerase
MDDRVLAEGATSADLERAVVSRCHATETRARVGLIIPSSNRMTEPQFHRYAPEGVAIHVARVQMTGRHKKPIAQLLDEVGRAASALADARCNPIVFHCTGTAMAEGLEGEAALVARVVSESAAHCFSTAQAVVEALRALDMTRVVLFSPYPQATNDHEKDFLAAHGITVARDVALNVGVSDDYIRVPVTTWIELAREQAQGNMAAQGGVARGSEQGMARGGEGGMARGGADFDGFFLSCTNTTQIEAIATIERETGKPAVNSNQAVLWAALRRIAPALGPGPGDFAVDPALGRLFAAPLVARAPAPA